MNENIIQIDVGTKPPLDPGFIPAVLWNKTYCNAVKQSGKAQKIIIALERNNNSVSTYATKIFPHTAPYLQLNIKYIERLIRSLLWLKGGYKLTIAGCGPLAEDVRKIYSTNGARSFDADILGRRIYGRGFEVIGCTLTEAPENREVQKQLGEHMDGCRVEFNLGGSDRKCTAVMDGEVTALAGSLAMKVNSVLGISMGTSMAGGYVTAQGSITDWLNEPAFAPVDYRNDAPVDEWSGDRGYGVQYFSHQAVARLARIAGIALPEDMAFPERLLEIQNLTNMGDVRAEKIYENIGVYLAYSVAHYVEFYNLENLLILGRVTSGSGGDLILKIAKKVLEKEFPVIALTIKLRTPDEQFKRHGQAVIAASLPPIIKR
jgi:hypothetical protein